MVRSTVSRLARSPRVWWAIAGALGWGVACSAAPAAQRATLLSGADGGAQEREASESSTQTAADTGGEQNRAGDRDETQGVSHTSAGMTNVRVEHTGASNSNAANAASHTNATNAAAGNTTNTTNTSNTAAGNTNASHAAAGNARSGNGSASNAAPANAGSSGGSGHNDAVEEAVRQALTFDLPEPSLSKRKRRKLWATYYYVPEVEHLKGGFSLRNMNGAALGPRLSRRNWCNAAMQGTVLIVMPDGSSATYNYAGTRKNLEVDCSSIFPRHRAVGRTRFIRARGRWGDGSGGRLLPLRTIAADPRVIPDGSTLYIPAARGTQITLPDGSSATHDGFFYAADHGGAIKQHHIDVFVGVGRNNPFAFVRSSKKHTFEAYLISPRSPAAQRLRQGHRTR